MKLWRRAGLVGGDSSVEGDRPEEAPSTSESDSDDAIDYYYLIRRDDNPHFEIYNAEEVQALIRSAPWNPPSWISGLLRRVRKPPPYHCATQLALDKQDEKTPTSSKRHTNRIVAPRIFLGRVRGLLTLWANGSVINWAARRDGWSSNSNAIGAVRACAWATERWNRALAGRVIFRYVDRCDDCAFLLEPAHDEGDVLAESFAPNAAANTVNVLFVYDAAFRHDNAPFLRGTLLHELGHVVGLRHEHAQETEDSSTGPESISFGRRNKKSVMAYYRGQRIRLTDVMAVRTAYDTLHDGMVVKGKGKSGVVEKTVRRVHPDN